jgi:hypothetical protein
MASQFSVFRIKTVTFGVAAGLLLAGCAGGSVANDASLSPAENQLRQSNARFNQTVGEGPRPGRWSAASRDWRSVERTEARLP